MIKEYFTTKQIIKYISLGLVSGATSFMFLTFVNMMIGLLMEGTYNNISLSYVILFILVILLFVWSRRALANAIIKLSQRFFWRIRSEVIDITLNSGNEQMNERREEIRSVLVHDVGTLTNVSVELIPFMTSVVVVISCLVYMAMKSMPLFIATVITALLGVGIYALATARNNRMFLVTRDLETRFMRHFESILNGFKEIHIDHRKGKEINEQKIKAIASESFENNTRAFIGFLNIQMTGQVLFYMLIASILLFFGVVFNIKASTTVNFLFVLLYLLSSIETIMVLYPGIMRARISANRLAALRKDLELNTSNNTKSKKTISIAEFDKIEVSDLEFTYRNEKKEEAFHIGPIQFEMNKGEIVFVNGGNGSGKTTFMHAFLGLLKFNKGTISFNQTKLNDENYCDYKSMFAVVFNDFYLFDEFYGMPAVDVERAKSLLELFEIEEKVVVEENRFSTIDLSTGQRKRLALISALLENKPVLVLDEWAADQDPYFRKKFYTEILPYIASTGVAVFAITHDDKYYHCADKVYRMEYGKLHKEHHNQTLMA